VSCMNDRPTWTEPGLRAALDDQGFRCEGTLPEVTWFGDSPTMAAELGELVRTGRKRATASLMWSWEEEGELLSVAGEQEVVIDWAGRPLAVIELTEVSVLPFIDVDARFANDEGEGDRSLKYWRVAHHSFFERECSRISRQMTEDALVVCVRFRLVHGAPSAA
jgi:uncharacterized protein YhfF